MHLVDEESELPLRCYQNGFPEARSFDSIKILVITWNRQRRIEAEIRNGNWYDACGTTRRGTSIFTLRPPCAKPTR